MRSSSRIQIPGAVLAASLSVLLTFEDFPAPALAETIEEVPSTNEQASTTADETLTVQSEDPTTDSATTGTVVLESEPQVVSQAGGSTNNAHLLDAYAQAKIDESLGQTSEKVSLVAQSADKMLSADELLLYGYLKE